MDLCLQRRKLLLLLSFSHSFLLFIFLSFFLFHSSLSLCCIHTYTIFITYSTRTYIHRLLYILSERKLLSLKLFTNRNSSYTTSEGILRHKLSEKEQLSYSK